MPRRLTFPAVMAAAPALLVLAAALSGPARAQADLTPEMKAQARAVMTACRGDYSRLCGGITPGGGRIFACLQTHIEAVSPPCREVLPAALPIPASEAAPQ